MTPEEIKAMAEQVKDQVKEASKELDNQVKADMTAAIEAKFNELKAAIPDISKVISDFAELQKSVDKLAAESRRMPTPETETKSFAKELEAALKSDDFKNYVQAKRNGAKTEFQKSFSGVTTLQTKATVTPGTATASVVAPQQSTTIYHDPDRRTRIRDFFPVLPISSNRAVVPVEKTITDGTAVTGEGVQKGVSQFTLDIESFPVTKIASVQKISEEMFDDIPGLTAYITTRFGAKLKNKEDYTLLYNTESSTEFGGLTAAAQVYDDDLADTAVNKWDVLRNAITQAITDEYQPTVIFLHPADIKDLRSVKGSDEHYIGGSAPWSPAPLMCDGVPIVSTTAIGSGEFLVGDAAMGAVIYDRMTPSIRFFDQDEDNAQKNLITVVVEERLTLAIVRPNAFVYGDFASALAEGTA